MVLAVFRFRDRAAVQRRKAQSSGRWIIRHGLRLPVTGHFGHFHGLVGPPSRTRLRLWGSTLRSFPLAETLSDVSITFNPPAVLQKYPVPGRFNAGGRPANSLMFKWDGGGHLSRLLGLCNCGPSRRGFVPTGCAALGFASSRYFGIAVRADRFRALPLVRLGDF